ncbi:MAG: 30S ribosomal protein S9 [Patescibacteria group bacterium]
MTPKVNTKEEIKNNSSNSDKYYEAVGRRKTASARVRLFANQLGIKVNDKDYKEYFREKKHQDEIEAPFKVAGLLEKFGATIKVRGSGISAQAGAVRHGLARSLVKYNEELKKKMRSVGLLTRDARMVERKKPGLKKARRAPQWSKR